MRADISLSAEGKAPTSIVLLKKGLNASDHYGEGNGGEFVFDDVSAAMVMQKFQDAGRARLYGDWNHGMLVPSASRDQASACCSFVPAIDGDGNLVAGDIEWTDDGREDVESRAYNLFSPAYSWSWCDDGVCRVTGLVNFALVNLAGLKGIPELLAASSALIDPSKESVVNHEELYTQAKADLDKANARIRELETTVAKAGGASTQIAAMSMAIGLKADATDTERLSTMNGLTALRSGVLAATGTETTEAALAYVKGVVALRSSVLSITGKDSPEAAVAALQVMKGSAEQLATLQASIEQEKVAAMTSEWDGLWASAVSDFKVTPADVETRKGQLLAITGGKVTKELITAARSAIGAQAPIVKGSGTPPAKAGSTLITDADKQLHAMMGGASPVSLEQIAAHREKAALIR